MVFVFYFLVLLYNITFAINDMGAIQLCQIEEVWGQVGASRRGLRIP